MDPALQQALELGAGAGADRLDPLTAFAEHDRPLAGPLDIDHLLDAHAAVAPVLPALGLDRRGVRQLVVQLQKDLLAGDFGGDQALGRVRQLIFGKEPRARWHRGGEMPLQILDAIAIEPGDHKDRVEPAFLRQGRGQAEQRVAAHQIDLVQRQDRAAAALGQALEDAPGVAVEPARGVDQQHGRVGILGPRPGRRHHRPVEPAARREDARRVDVDELRRPLDRNAEQARARRLGLGGDDRQLMADQAVQQGRFAGVRRADQRHIAAAGG